MPDWSKLEQISPNPEKWLKVYEHYQDLLTREDVAGFYAEQFEMQLIQHTRLKEKLQELKDDFEQILALNKLIGNHNDDSMITIQYISKQKQLIERIIKVIYESKA